MPQVTFRSHDISIDVSPGTLLLDAVRIARIRMETPCNGGGTCGKCKVKLDEGALSRVRRVETKVLTAEEIDNGWATLCSTLVDDDIALDLPGASERGLRILEEGQRLDLPLEPWISKRFKREGYATEVYAGAELLGKDPGDTTARTYGVAVDIGTTTIVASLVDLGTGSQVGSDSSLNPQVVHAQDVLSRVKLASTPDGLALLHSEIAAEIDRLIGLLAFEARISRRRIYEVVIAGNTCMLHLAANVSPEALGRYPYTPALTGGQHLQAKALGLTISQFGVVYVPPVISGFVGADITAGMLSTGLADLEGVTLFVDIGTNGEMVLARDGHLQATSTAAGPAFEGMNIACGMRAAEGAIERVSLEGGVVRTKTISDAEAVGLCGSGLMDAVAELAVHGVIESSGRFTKDRSRLPQSLQAQFANRDGKPIFRLTENVYLSQGDIRQVQLAKGAVRAGIDILLQRNGLTPAGVDRALIAGSFGYHLTARSLIDIGLFPPEFDGKVHYVGNTSRTGAETLLTNASSRGALLAAVRNVDAVELANDEGFQKTFVSALAFPQPAIAPLKDVA
jgi:uncharacterized 2Fe-2S/4Fe-4S cluster protein (DUF4445 family)